MENMLLNHKVIEMTKYTKQELDINLKLKPNSEKSDIYIGEENIRFDNRHPIFKALMKLEFEDVIRNYHKRICPR